LIYLSLVLYKVLQNSKSSSFQLQVYSTLNKKKKRNYQFLIMIQYQNIG